MKTIPIDLCTLRNLIFDVGGLDREFVDLNYIPHTLSKEIFEADKENEYFKFTVHSDNESRIWHPRAWKASAERHYAERARNAKDVSRHELRKEALAIFAKKLFLLTPSMNREERIAIGEMLLRKRNFIKFASISGLDITEEKWKGLME